MRMMVWMGFVVATTLVQAVVVPPALAQAQQKAVTATHATQHATEKAHTPEQAFVYQVAAEVLQVVRSNGSEASAKKALESVFTTYVDIEWVGQFVLGRHWRTANPDQKQRFITAYRSFMVGGYTRRLREYSGDDYTVSSPRALGEGRSALTMQVKRPQGAPVVIDYKIRTDGATYKIYDLVVEGISLITTQRSEFDSVVNRKGLDFLIQALAKKAAQVR
jgi:phospholipid transport system substrate-binding protein